MFDRLGYTLASAGCPVDRITGVAPNVTLTYMPWLTAEQLTAAQTLAASVLAAFDWSQAAHDAWLLGRRRDDASGQLSSSQANHIVLRAVMLTLLDEVNNLRGWITSFKSAVAASSSLADLRTRVAALANTPDRTAQQARGAIANKITSGGADQ